MFFIKKTKKITPVLYLFLSQKCSKLMQIIVILHLLTPRFKRITTELKSV